MLAAHPLVPAAPAAVSTRRPVVLTWAVVVVAGLALGVVDLWLQEVLPYPWANLANSSAVWAAAAVGAWVARGRFAPAGAGVLALALATESYYLAGVWARGDDVSTLWSVTAAFWLLASVLAGIVFGTAGAWTRRAPGLLRTLGVALPTAVLLGEALLRVWRSGAATDAAQRHDGIGTALIEVGLAVLVALVAGRDHRTRALGFLAALPLSALGFAAFALAGMG